MDAPRLTSGPCQIPPEISSALQYLEILLEYDSKTRNLPSTIAHLSEAFSVHHLERIPGGPPAVYRLASAGPLTSLPFLDELSRAVHNFLTPGQVVDTAREVVRTLKDVYERFSERGAKVMADHGDGPRKKRRKDTPLPSEGPSELEYHAVAFALVAKVMVVVLRSLPLHTLTEAVRAEAEQLIAEGHATVAIRALEEGFGKTDRRESWPWQLVLTGALHLHYGLALAPASRVQGQVHGSIPSAILSCLSSHGTTPELIVEMVSAFESCPLQSLLNTMTQLRTLMHQCSIGAMEPDVVLDGLLSYLESHLGDDGVSWSGKAHSLSGHSAGGVAVLHLLVDRWLPDFE